MIFYHFGDIPSQYPNQLYNDMEIGTLGQAWCIILESDGLSELYHSYEGQVHGSLTNKLFNKDPSLLVQDQVVISGFAI